MVNGSSLTKCHPYGMLVVNKCHEYINKVASQLLSIAAGPGAFFVIASKTVKIV